MNGRYVSLMKQAREEKDPIQKSTRIIEILDMMCTNDLLHIYDHLKKVREYFHSNKAVESYGKGGDR